MNVIEINDAPGLEMMQMRWKKVLCLPTSVGDASFPGPYFPALRYVSGQLVAHLTPIGCKQARGRSYSWRLMSLFSSLSLAPYWRDSSSAKQTSYGTDKVFRRGAYSTPTMLTRRGAEYVQQADMSKYWGLWTGLRPGEFFTLTFLVLLVSFSSSYKILAAPTTCTLEWLVY